MSKGEKLLAGNPNARHDYHILSTYEAGMELTGTEVKSIRRGKVNIRDSYINIRQGEMWLLNTHVSPYEEGNRFNVDPLRKRRLLMHKQEIRVLEQKVRLDGLTLVPLRVYLRKGIIKLELGLARGKKNYDKRQDMIKREAERAIKQHL